MKDESDQRDEATQFNVFAKIFMSFKQYFS